MAKWLEPKASRSKLPTVGRGPKSSQLPALADVWSTFLAAVPAQKNGNGQLPNASLIYGAASAALFAIALYFLFTGLWFTGILVMFPASVFLGYALHFLRYPM